MKTSRKFLLSGGILFLIFGLVVCLGCVWWIWRTKVPQIEQPTLRVLQPQPNASLNLQVPVMVQAASSTKETSIAWLRFYVDNLLAGEQNGPGQQIIGTWKWTPSTPGMHTLSFVAATEQGVQNMLNVPIVVLAALDRDGDNLPDKLDACADQPGVELNHGCPIPDDSDGDGIRDAEDVCPEEAGVVEQHGCLVSNRPDQDRDGIADWEDHCPTQPGLPQWNGCPQDALLTDGDGDGLVDAIDSCANQAGPAENNGCPAETATDRDGDGVMDDQDNCPDQPGAAQNGCPLTSDRDHDGIADDVDSCPDNPNPNFACMDVHLTDSDGDGIWDVIDDCPDQAGVLEQQGCPNPNDQDGDGIVDDADNCDSRPGPASNAGCPTEINYPRVGVRQNILCLINPSACSSSDIDCNANPERCGISESCAQDNDCDGVINEIDQCPYQFGGYSNQGCPPDVNHDGVPDADQDQDGVADIWDACPQERGMASNGGCRRENVALTLFLIGFYTPQHYSNFYCYFKLQEGDWGRIPQEGSLVQSGQTFAVNQGISLNLAGNEMLRYQVFCEGQTNPLTPAQVIGTITRAHGAEYWNSQILDAFSDNGQLLVEYRICERSCP
ncbi:MAG: thrombospondin type 3 repeat-containing protein [Anaerolineales bacterium]